MMGKKGFHSKFIPFQSHEGILEVKLRSPNFQVVYESEVGINDEKNLKKMLMTLHQKGVNLDFLFKDKEQLPSWW